MDWLREFLAGSEVLRLFVVIALGYLLGEVRLPGRFRFGVAAVLFVGLGLSAWDGAAGGGPERFRVSEAVSQIGLGLFIYCIGLDAAPGFFRTIRSRGLFVILSAAAAVGAAAAVIVAATHLGNRPAALMAGAFCGAVTNTPALATVTDALRLGGADPATQALAVVGYGTVYPFALIGLLLLFQFLLVPRGRAASAPGGAGGRWVPPASIAIDHEREPGVPWTVREAAMRFDVVITRVRQPDGMLALADGGDVLALGQAVVAVGPEAALTAAAEQLGHALPEPLSKDGFEVHRYSLSNHAFAGRPLRELGLAKIGAVVSRIRRGDVDLPVRGDTVLQLGDRIRVVSYPDVESQVRKLIGNSMQVLGETGYLTFALGIVLGLLLGSIPIPVPGLPSPLHLGVAGGPLVMALILGALGRTGPFVWQLPPSANLTLRQFGLLLFLAAVGLKAGGGLIPALQADGVFLVLVGTAAMLALHVVLWGCLWAGGERDAAAYAGQSSGLQTQPAALAFASARLSPAAVAAGYATIFPFATVFKVLVAQLLVAG